MTLNSSLLQWLETFKLDDKTSLKLKDDAYYSLADGYICALILNQISPQYFSDKWLDGIKPVASNGSWRLRLSNLNRILQKIHDYTSDLQSSKFRPDAITPDVAVIAQNFDPNHISKLIQLLLFCAINCDRKEYYVEKIRHLPTQVQQDIKEAIVELLIQDSTVSNDESNISQTLNHSGLRENGINSSSSILSPHRSPVSRFMMRRDSSQSSVHYSKMSESKQDAVFNTSQSQIDEDELENLAIKQNTKLQTEINKLKEELIKVETEREDYRLKASHLKDDLEKLTIRHNELKDQAEQAKRLQDELDEQRYISEKVVNYETMVDNLLKKNNELKREIKSVEEKSTMHIQKIASLEEENNQLTSSIARNNIYKKQLQESQMKLSQEAHRADKAEVELSRLTEKYSNAIKENDKLREATNQLLRRSPGNKNQTTAGTSDSFGRPTDAEFELLNSKINPSDRLSANLYASPDNTLALVEKVDELQRRLFQKDQELMDSEAKYKRNLQKAKDVIKTLNSGQSMNSSLHPSCMSSTSSFNSSSLDETILLKQQLREREERLVELEREFYEFKKFKEIHERLIVSAFLDLVSSKLYQSINTSHRRHSLTIVFSIT